MIEIPKQEKKSYVNYLLKFEDIKNKTPKELTKLIMEKDKICKNVVMKLYRNYSEKSMSKAYDLFYQKQIWSECIKPLLIVYGINKGIINDVITCPSCGRKLQSYQQIVAHHKDYPRLVPKWQAEGFYLRNNFNHPSKIYFMCVKCHRQFHKYLIKHSLYCNDVNYSYFKKGDDVDYNGSKFWKRFYPNSKNKIIW